VGAQNLRDPFACPEIIAQLPSVMEQLHIDSLKDIIACI
jgi:dihydroorotate dehydrogenase (NAD+) catalytic subunit